MWGLKGGWSSSDSRCRIELEGDVRTRVADRSSALRVRFIATAAAFPNGRGEHDQFAFRPVFALAAAVSTEHPIRFCNLGSDVMRRDAAVRDISPSDEG